MTALLQGYAHDRNGTAMAPIAVWIVLSILLHVMLLLWTPRPRPPDPELPPSLTVTLQPRPEVARPPEPAPPPPPVIAPRPPAPKPPPPQAKRAPKAPPRVIALDKPRPKAPPKIEEVPVPPPAPVPQAPPATDLMAYVEARRRARGEVPRDSAEVERDNRPVLKQPSPSALEEERRRNGYGSFEIRRRGYDYAEYMFRGWNANFRRDGLELIEVQKGNNASIDLAVVRSIIGIIRRTEKGDFTWVSRRLGRTLTLSARPRDNAGLEEFMMQEFYDDLHRYR